VSLNTMLIRKTNVPQFCALLAVCFVAGEAVPLLGQGCSMCKSSLQGQADTIVNSIKMGIVVMLLPATAIMTGILLALRHRSQVGHTPNQPMTRPSPISQDVG